MTSISLSVGVGLMCALPSALATNLAFLLKYKGAVDAPDVDMRHPLRSAVDLFRSKWWSIGSGVAVGAFVLHASRRHGRLLSSFRAVSTPRARS